MSTYNFINPYNFIPLGEGKVKSVCETELYTGVIEYSLLTKTPLFIPNTSNEKAFDGSKKIKFKQDENIEKYKKDHKSYDFFSYADLSKEKNIENSPKMPVIPGSEIRGLIRSNYEILTNSCMFSVDDDEILGKRTTHAFEAGLIKKDGELYTLYKAEDCLYREAGKSGNWKNAYNKEKWIEGARYEDLHIYRQKVGKPLVAWKNKNGKGYRTLIEDKKTHKVYEKTVDVEFCEHGYMIKGEASPKGKNEKHNLHVFALTNTIVSENTDISVLDAALKAYKKQREDAYNGYYEQWELFKQGKGNEYFPVYYCQMNIAYKENKEKVHTMLSPAVFTREIYGHKLGDMINEYKKCNDKKELCPACALFGTLEKHFNKASRVRFSDLQCVTDLPIKEMYKEITTLSALSTPKLSNMEFYFKQPSEDAIFWTVDYWIDKRGNIHSYLPEINGRKFYWHFDVKDNKEEATNLNSSIRPLKKGVKFAGKLYFENIDKKELDALIYTLIAGDEKVLGTKTNGYKLGHAKPLGYGSVEIAVDKVLLRKVEKCEHMIQISNIEYNVPTFKENNVPLIDADIISNFKMMTDFNAVDSEFVKYPSVNGIVYEWFTKNHTARRYDKVGRGYEEIAMPNNRTQMAYNEYMEAMCPALQKTKFEETIKVYSGNVSSINKDVIVIKKRNGETLSSKIIKNNFKIEADYMIKYTKMGDGIHIIDSKPPKNRKSK